MSRKDKQTEQQEGSVIERIAKKCREHRDSRALQPRQLREDLKRTEEKDCIEGEKNGGLYAPPLQHVSVCL